MNTADFVDETFDINQSSTYTLIFQLSEAGLSYIIYDPVRNKYIVLKHIPFEKDLPQNMFLEAIDEVFDCEKKLDARYKKVHFLVVNRKSTLLPAPYFKEDQLKKVLEFNTTLDELDEIHYNYLSIIDSYNVFSVPNPIANEFIEKYGAVHFFHHSTPLIYSALQVHEGGSDTNSVLVDVHASTFEIAVYQNGHFTLYNQFAYHDENDLAYYVLYVYHQLSLDPMKDPLYVTGNIQKQSDYMKNLTTFVNTVEVMIPDNRYLYSYTFKKTELHQFANLFNLLNCV